ncbi:MAG TPA: hypothetical protein VN285_10635, partial [Candidatus Deferrimicrobium sp.]|nr:hypothetical protein [Candidatus Deferrimicrobium sp.]
MKALFLLMLTVVMVSGGCIRKVERKSAAKPADTVAATGSGPTIFDGERHLTNLRQLTLGGQNAEAYFSFDASELIFQSTRE